MSRIFCFPSLAALFFLFACVAFVMPSAISAHCDSYSGPVIIAAKQALEKGAVTSVLKWVKKEDEAKITEAFKKTMAVSAKGPEAKELADNYFFENDRAHSPSRRGRAVYGPENRAGRAYYSNVRQSG